MMIRKIWGLVLFIAILAPNNVFAGAKAGELDLLFTEHKDTFYSNGKPSAKGNMGVFGIKDSSGKTKFVRLHVGKWETWWPNGKKQTVTNYCSGLALKQHACKFGQKHGASKAWYSSGLKRSSLVYKAGKAAGTGLSWYSNGQLKSRSKYQDGLRSGLETAWWQNGLKSREGHYANGHREGAWKSWYFDGKLKNKSSYHQGNLHGSWTEWWSICSPRGCFHRKMIQGLYSNGKRSGSWKFWDLRGKSISELLWKGRYGRN